MKKVVRMLGLCALVALAFTSCKKNETNSTVTFKASITQPTSDSRTYLDALSRRVMWSPEDKITVFNDQANYIECSLPSDLGKNVMEASFQGDAAFLANLDTPNSYTAFYPVKNVTGENVSVEIPDEQVYETESFATNLYPMYAVNGGEYNDNFTFNSRAGILCIKLKMDPDAGLDPSQYRTIKKLILTSGDANDKLVGTMVYPYNYPLLTEPQYEVPTWNHEVAMINCNTSPLGTDARSFNFILLEGALQGGTFTLTILDEADQPIFAQPIQGTLPTINNHVGIVAQQRIYMEDLIIPVAQ